VNFQLWTNVDDRSWALKKNDRSILHQKPPKTQKT